MLLRGPVPCAFVSVPTEIPTQADVLVQNIDCLTRMSVSIRDVNGNAEILIPSGVMAPLTVALLRASLDAVGATGRQEVLKAARAILDRKRPDACELRYDERFVAHRMAEGVNTRCQDILVPNGMLVSVTGRGHRAALAVTSHPLAGGVLMTGCVALAVESGDAEQPLFWLLLSPPMAVNVTLLALERCCNTMRDSSLRRALGASLWGDIESTRPAERTVCLPPPTNLARPDVPYASNHMAGFFAVEGMLPVRRLMTVRMDYPGRPRAVAAEGFLLSNSALEEASLLVIGLIASACSDDDLTELAELAHKALSGEPCLVTGLSPDRDGFRQWAKRALDNFHTGSRCGDLDTGNFVVTRMAKTPTVAKGIRHCVDLDDIGRHTAGENLKGFRATLDFRASALDRGGEPYRLLAELAGVNGAFYSSKAASISTTPAALVNLALAMLVESAQGRDDTATRVLLGRLQALFRNRGVEEGPRSGALADLVVTDVEDLLPAR